jgi:hypothetical protein
MCAYKIGMTAEQKYSCAPLSADSVSAVYCFLKNFEKLNK